MTIIHVIPSLNVGGAETMMKNLVIEQLHRDNAVVVVEFCKADTSIRKELEANGIEIISLDKKLGFDFSVIVKLRKLFKEKKPDVVHTHLHVLPYVFLAFPKCQIVHTIHTIAEKERSGIAVYITRFIFHSSKVTPVAISEEIRKSISNFHHLPESQVPVALNGVSLTKYYRKENYDLGSEVRIVHVGSLIPLKNHKLMIDVAEKLKNSNIQFTLECAGAGILHDNLQSIINNKGLNGCVKLVGLQSKINLFLKNADIFIFPSQYEGVPMSLIEAMASGLPIIASNVGGIPDMVSDGKNAVLINPSAEDLYSAIITVINNKELRKTIGEAAVIESKRFSSSAMCERYISIYRNTVR